MKKIRISFIIGIILLITGIIIGQFAGHQHLTKGMLIGISVSFSPGNQGSHYSKPENSYAEIKPRMTCLIRNHNERSLSHFS